MLYLSEISTMQNISNKFNWEISMSNEYRVWVNLKQRCYNPNNPGYPDYGGRGITVCDRWKDSYKNFIADMGLRPSPDHSIERDDVNGNYEPSNCRWATDLEQARNRRNNVYYDIDGEKLTESEVSRKYGVSPQVIRYRLGQGMTLKQAVAPVRPVVLYTYEGRTMSLKQWAVFKNIPYNTLYSRVVSRGWAIEKALLTT